MAAICLLCALIVLRFWLIGAWPVAGFGVVEIGLAIFLLRLNASRARASELVLLSEDALRIVRTDRHGRRKERVLPVGWLNAVLEEPPGRVPRLLLVARGVREEIADALGEEEKRDLGRRLRDALHRLRNPRFDNPQLRLTDRPDATRSGLGRSHRLDQVEHALAHRGIGDAVVGPHQFQCLAPVQRIVGEAVLRSRRSRRRGGWPGRRRCWQGCPACRRRRS